MPIAKTIEFLRSKKFEFRSKIGEGACGETIRIYDNEIDCDFVAKKYSPIVSKTEQPELFEELLNRFKSEAKILFRLNHPNIVRIFNFYDYREIDTGYIVMEFVQGSNILEHLEKFPNAASEIFEGVIDGFVHLEESNILHRDIRPANILISEKGMPKIIDFGFGKALPSVGENAQKSITLNWWCAVPPEFEEGIYDVQTEIYFVGKLFEEAIGEFALGDFKYKSLVRKMCEPQRNLRLKTFAALKREISSQKFDEIDFLDREIEIYRLFSSDVCDIYKSIDLDASYRSDIDEIVRSLKDLYRRTMLEEFVPDVVKLARIFVYGSFRYLKNTDVKVDHLRQFSEMVSSFSTEKRNVVILNLFSKLDSVERQRAHTDLDDEVPF
jgi:serine/threonine-protein kinase